LIQLWCYLLDPVRGLQKKAFSFANTSDKDVAETPLSR
jgi:hypothetical protein